MNILKKCSMPVLSYQEPLFEQLSFTHNTGWCRKETHYSLDIYTTVWHASSQGNHCYTSWSNVYQKTVRSTMKNHLKRSLFLCVLATVVTVLLLTTPGTKAAALTCGTWNVVSTPNVASSNNTLRSVAVVSGGNIW